MSIMKDMDEESKAKYKAEKLEEVREYHLELLKDLDITKFDLNMKSQFTDDQGRIVVGIFPSEFKKTIGFFFELIDFDLNPIDTKRKIYRIQPNDHYDEEFECHPKGFYMVPMDEIREVNKDSVAITGSTAVTASDSIFKPTAKAQEAQKHISSQPVYVHQYLQTVAPDDSTMLPDAPFSALTIRDLYTIMTGKPASNKEWLNELVNNK